MWPSQSTKKKYSHALRLLGRDSIFVMLMRCLRKGARALCKAPASWARLIIKLVRSLPVGGEHWRPSTRKRVALLELSCTSDSRIFRPYFSAARDLARAAACGSLAASWAARVVEEVSCTSTCERCACNQARHWPSGCG